ncbi:hypothetical protein [Methyloferula stellata]|uniref:hypothetical protein n=1 Tax=Methyloferula stellata TaxID=876270 RepID=UPI0003772CC4|nr:hypothetical protein [Methyloferula stellata]
MPRTFIHLVLAAALVLCHSSARAEMQRLRVCIGENASHCDGTFSDFYKIRRGLKGDVDQIAGKAICTMAKGHLLSVNADEARETHDGDCCGYVFVTIECEIDPVSQLPPSRAR